MFENQLPGCPLVEHPFFEKILCDFDERTASIARDLHENGFAVLDFPDPDFHQMADGIMRDFKDLYQWQKWRDGNLNSLRIQDAWQFDARVKSIAANEDILALLTRLYGRRAFPFQTLNFAVGTQQALHCDYVHFDSIPERFMCGVWVALEDIDATNGPLFYYPGSHKWPSYGNQHLGIGAGSIIEGYEHYPRYLKLWQEMANHQKIKSQTFLAKKGQALIWMSNLAHGGSPMLDKNRTRWSQVTHYFFDGCGYTTPIANDVYKNSVYYRNIVDVTTGNKIPNMISGQALTRDEIDRAKPAHVREAELPTPLQTVPEWENSSFKEHALIPRGFDPMRYLVLNPDLSAVHADPYHHFIAHGLAENRLC